MAFARLLDRTGRLRGNLNRLQLRLVAYLTRGDEEVSERRRLESFQDLLLAVNPSVYKDVYDDQGNIRVRDEDIDWEVPSGEADVQRMMEELRRTGVV